MHVAKLALERVSSSKRVHKNDILCGAASNQNPNPNGWLHCIQRIILDIIIIRNTFHSSSLVLVLVLVRLRCVCLSNVVSTVTMHAPLNVSLACFTFVSICSQFASAMWMKCAWNRVQRKRYIKCNLYLDKGRIECWVSGLWTRSLVSMCGFMCSRGKSNTIDRCTFYYVHTLVSRLHFSLKTCMNGRC